MASRASTYYAYTVSECAEISDLTPHDDIINEVRVINPRLKAEMVIESMNKQFIYVPPSSNEQIKYILSQSRGKYGSGEFIKLLAVLIGRNMQTNERFGFDSIVNQLNLKGTDREIINRVLSKVKTYTHVTARTNVSNANSTSGNTTTDTSATAIAPNKITVDMEYIVGIIRKSVPSSLPSTVSYLDFGCGDCYKTSIISRMLGLSDKNAHGVDIEEWSNITAAKNRQSHPMVTFTPVKESTPLPFPDNTFDVVTIMMVIHHIKTPQLRSFMIDINRVVKPGGIVVIVEHDVRCALDAMIIDIEHTIYEVSSADCHSLSGGVDLRTNYDHCSSNGPQINYYSRYFSAAQFNTLFKKFGFTPIVIETFPTSDYFDISADRKYIAVYQKK
jgi:2-polyprenyl-3-methyl-5-hydroxy-6-metoxy-1,4-benzoquinol methylase